MNPLRSTISLIYRLSRPLFVMTATWAINLWMVDLRWMIAFLIVSGVCLWWGFCMVCENWKEPTQTRTIWRWLGAWILAWAATLLLLYESSFFTQRVFFAMRKSQLTHFVSRPFSSVFQRATEEGSSIHESEALIVGKRCKVFSYSVEQEQAIEIHLVGTWLGPVHVGYLFAPNLRIEQINERHHWKNLRPLDASWYWFNYQIAEHKRVRREWHWVKA